MDLAKNPTSTPPTVIPKVRWDPELHIQETPSITYGKVEFNVESMHGRKPAKVIRFRFSKIFI